MDTDMDKTMNPGNGAGFWKRAGKKAGAVIGLSVMGVGILAGCGVTDPNNNPSAGIEKNDELSKNKAADFIKSYYKAIVDASKNSTDDYSKMMDVIQKNTTTEEQAQFSDILTNPENFYKVISDDSAKKMLPELEKLDKLNDKFDTSGLNDKQKLYLHILNITMPNGYIIYGATDLTVTIDPDKIQLNTDDKTATANISDFKFTSQGKDVPTSGMTMKHLKLKDSDGHWKMDGEDFLNEISNYFKESRQAASATPSDSASDSASDGATDGASAEPSSDSK